MDSVGFPCGAMNNVPGLHTIDEILDGAAHVHAGQHGNEACKDCWVCWGSVLLCDVFDVAEQMESKEAGVLP